MEIDDFDLEYRINYGKHAGTAIKDLPLSYCKWLLDEEVAKGELKRILEIISDEIYFHVEEWEQVQMDRCVRPHATEWENCPLKVKDII